MSDLNVNGGEVSFTSLHEHALFPAHIQRAAQYLVSNLALVPNGPVCAIAGNANNPDLLAQIDVVKGPARQSRPVGWTVPFGHGKTAGVYDTSKLDPEIREPIEQMLEDTEGLNQRFGGVAFLRGPADLNIKETQHIPDAIIPQPNDSGESSVQIFSPVGSHAAEQLIQAMINAGAEPVMTSANKSGQPEIVTELEMIEFMKETGLRRVHLQYDSEHPRFRSSYPIFEITKQGISLVRSGFVSKAVLKRVVADLPLAPDFEDDVPSAQYPDRVMDFSHLPADARMAQGSEMRNHILAALKKPLEYTAVA